MMLKRAGRDVRLVWLYVAAMLLDILLWLLVLARVEAVRIPANLRTMADVRFDFPYSHGLLASVCWSAAAFPFGWWVVGRKAKGRMAAALVLAAAVFSHFVLDWLVHAPELPLAGRGSTLLGFHLLQNPPVALGVETAIAIAGVWVYLKTQSLGRRRKLALLIVMTLVAAMTVLGQLSHTAPPSSEAMAGSSLATIVTLGLFFWWVERGSTQPASFRGEASMPASGAGATGVSPMQPSRRRRRT